METEQFEEREDYYRAHNICASCGAEYAGSWEPMSTHPTDGREFIAAIPVYSAHTKKFTHWERNIISDGDGTPMSEADYGWRLEDYTHWMPLADPPPEPPTENKD